MNAIQRCLLLIISITLSGCSTFNNINTPVIKQCQQQCKMRFITCKQTCVDNCPRCTAKSFAVACKNHSKYIREKQIRGEILDRELKSYRDPLQCRKVTCNCVADVDICIQGCTGVIQKRLTPMPYCA